MKFDTTRFGQLDVESEDIVIFPDGPLGFPDCTRFTIVDEDQSYPFRMMQSLDNPALAFVIVDPLVARLDYHFNVTLEDLKNVKADATDGLQVFVIVTMSTNIKDVSVNLQGPLVINTEKKLGHQFVLVNTEYTTREKLLREVDAEQVKKERISAPEYDIKRKKAV